MPSVPNWIPRAVILTPGYGTSSGTVTRTTAWRATSTQVIVTVQGSRGPTERRFYLETLTQVGTSKRSRLSPRLTSPDDPEVMAAQSEQTIRTASARIQAVIDEQRLQDSGVDAETMVKKLFAVRVAVDEAIAEIGKVL